jgi:hypothetical protein
MKTVAIDLAESNVAMNEEVGEAEAETIAGPGWTPIGHAYNEWPQCQCLLSQRRLAIA